MNSIDIEEFVRALEKEEGSEFYFDLTKREVIAFDKSVLKQARKAPNDAAMPYRAFLKSRKNFIKINMPRGVLKQSMMEFVLTHSAIFKFDDFDLPFSSFATTLREYHLLDEWDRTVKTFVAPYFHRFALASHFEEKEADESLYLSIADELRVLKSNTYWHAISHNVFFEVH